MVGFTFLSVLSLVLLCVLGEEQCSGEEPMVTLAYGAANHWDVASYICCHNHRGAEDAGFLERSDINLFDKLDPNGQTVFYDSVCNKPLFVAPVGRSFEKFKEESVKHGWPSFRPEETIAANVKILEGGRMESICGTHLGHNLPDLTGARYCVDLVCVAGDGLSTTALWNNSNTFDPNSFVSRASDPGLGLPVLFIVGLVVFGVLAIVATVFICVLVQRSKASNKAIIVDEGDEQEHEALELSETENV